MKKAIRLAMLMSAAACIFSFLGCRNKHILDGPGMVNDLSWKAFTVSRSDSYAQHNFSFTVERGDQGFLLTGVCRDEEGNEYEVYDGIRLSDRDIKYLRDLDLGNFEDVCKATPDEVEESIILDAPTITMQVTYLDGVVRKKQADEALSLQLYQRFLPYFEKQ